MKVFETPTDFAKIESGCVLSIGNFDGVHHGHQKILSFAKKIASKKSVALTAMTFEPHPTAVLHPENTPAVLTPLPLKKHLLAGCGVDCLIVIKDTPALLSLSARRFVDEFLVKIIKPAVVVEGDDFNFGTDRDGNVHLLRQLGKENGFNVKVVESQTIQFSNGQTQRVSSSLIRDLLNKSKVADAALTLGRYYRLAGRIIQGKGIGKKLGCPTLNMQSGDQIIPAEGVYAGCVQIADSFEQACKSDEKLPAVFSIGRAQTFANDNPMNIEAHVLAEDFKNVSSQWMAMDFVRFIRQQQKFNSQPDLSTQIKEDCLKAKEILTLISH